MQKGYANIRDNEDYLEINCEDYDVEFFGGHDYEWEYSLNKENRNKLEAALRKEDGVTAATLEDMITEFFGACLDNYPFGEYCDQNGVQYNLWTWVS